MTKKEQLTEEQYQLGEALWEVYMIFQETNDNEIRNGRPPILDITKKSPKISSKRMKGTKKNQFIPITS